MGWWIALAILVLLAILPLGISVRYGSEGVLCRIIAGPLRILLYPRKKKSPEKEKIKPDKTSEYKPAEKKASGKKPEQLSPKAGSEKKQEAAGGSLTDFLPLVRVGLDLLGDLFGRKLRISCLELKLVLAGDDPCDLALNYGRAWAALGNLWPRLERMLVIQKRDVEICCDFTADQTLIQARLDATITLGRLLGLLVWYGCRALKEYLKIMKKRKGGAKHESNTSQYAGKYYCKNP